MRHAEILVDGEPDYETLQDRQGDRPFILAGTDRGDFEPHSPSTASATPRSRAGHGELSPDAIRAVVVHTDMARTGWFETSDARQPTARELVWSMRDNFVGVPTDCPQRDERLGWTGDLNAFAPTATFLYDVRDVFGILAEGPRRRTARTGDVPWVVPDVQTTPSPRPPCGATSR